MKKVITAGLSFAMAASMLAGCSSKPAENSDSGDKRVLKFDSFSGGNGEEVFTKLAKAFEKANSIEIPYVLKPRRAGDIAECFADATKAKKILGWIAEKSLEDMCRDSWNWQSHNVNGYK